LTFAIEIILDCEKWKKNVFKLVVLERWLCAGLFLIEIKNCPIFELKFWDLEWNFQKLISSILWLSYFQSFSVQNSSLTSFSTKFRIVWLLEWVCEYFMRMNILLNSNLSWLSIEISWRHYLSPFLRKITFMIVFSISNK
jgi:hypothetical protein